MNIRLIRDLFNLLKSLLFLPFLVLLWLIILKSNHFKEDININSIESLKGQGLFLNFCYLMVNNMYFRVLYLHRLKFVFNYFLKPFLFVPSNFIISPLCQIKGGLKILHPFSTIINAKSIGPNCVIRNNTTLGNKFDNSILKPEIGSNVNIGVGTIIIGDVIVGDNVIIGAGTVVTKSIKENTIVVGPKNRFI